VSEERSILDHFPQYEAVIGMEVHVQLTTQSKIFCRCSAGGGVVANSVICEICTGQPGTLPVLNEQVVTYAVMAGLATDCTINEVSEFARKHYFYPDLPKNYQITQAEKPICSNGSVKIRDKDGSIKVVRVMRIHIEEDAGKNIHASLSNESFVDLNRAGTPLLEIVSHPDMESAHQVKAYLKSLRSRVMYLNICSGNMEEGAFRADTNISLRKKGAQQLGSRVELKNINSFKFIGDAIEYEIERQINLLERGERVTQETRLWDSHKKITKVMRSKEEAADYRYMKDPDLPRIEIKNDFVEALYKQLPELPDQKLERFMRDYELSEYEAEILINDIALARYFEEAAALIKSRQLINWILRDLMGFINEHRITLAACKLTPRLLAELVDLVDRGVINTRTAQEVFVLAATSGDSPQTIVKERGLEQIATSHELEAIINEVITAHPSQVAEYRAGKTKLLGFFVGQAMAKTKGKGNPQRIEQLIKALIEKY
jgi:aspartyl-tRNA(Asn)/glutamyl-tRNA(Gln) amidotransferase subunit B